MKIAAISIADYCHSTQGMDPAVERLYFRMLLQMYSYEDGLPDDDRDNSNILGYRDVRTYKALKAKLLKWPKSTIYIEDGLIKNRRVEEELDKYAERKAKAVEDGRRGGKSSGVRRKNARRSQKDQAKIAERSGEDRQSIGNNKNNKINNLTEASPSPTPTPTKEKNPQGPPCADANEIARQAYLRGLEVKQGSVAKSARAAVVTKGELDGSRGITLQDGKLTISNGAAAELASDFPGLDLSGVCDRACPSIMKLRYPTRADAIAELRKWARIATEEAARKPSSQNHQRGSRTKADSIREVLAIVGRPS